MKTVCLIPSLAVFAAITSFAQVTPTTPTRFGTRQVGGTASSSSTGLAPKPAAETTVRHISYVSLGEPRQWTSSDGKPLLAKLIAWEQSEQIVVSGQPAPTPTLPDLPNGPTVVREEKIRLLVNGNPFELPLSRLSEADQAFVAQVVASISGKPEPAPKTSEPEASEGKP